MVLFIFSSAENRYTFLACFCIACMLWLANALADQKYNAEIRLGVLYKNLPKEKVLSKPLEDKLLLDVRGSGADLLRYQLGLIDNIVEVDYEKYINTKTKVQNTSDLMAKLENLGMFRISNVRPDSLYFYFEKKVSKRIPVKLSDDITTAKKISG